MYDGRLVEELREYKNMLCWIERCFGFSVKEANSLKCYMCEMICCDLESTWVIDVDMAIEERNEMHIKLKNMLFELLEVEYIEYKEREFDYFCLRTSVVPAEIGEGWIHMLKRDYRTTIDILNKLKRLYYYSFRRLTWIFREGISKEVNLFSNIHRCVWRQESYSRLYRMKLMFEKNMELNSLL